MKLKKNMLLAAALLLTSCTQKPDSTTSLYAFEAAQASRKSWARSPAEPKEHAMSESKEHAMSEPKVSSQVDTLLTDTLIEHPQN